MNNNTDSAIVNQQSAIVKVLLLEDLPSDAELVERELRKGGISFTLRRVDTREDFAKELSAFSPDIILSDYKLPSFNGLEALAIAQKECPEVPFILVSGTLGEEPAVETLKSGATDYVLKESLLRLPQAVRRAIKGAEEKREKKQAENEIRRMGKEWILTFNSITDWVSIQDKDFKIVRVNRAYADNFNMKPEELIGKPCYELVHGTKEPWPSCPHRQTLETKKPATEEFFEPHLGIYLETTTSPIFNENGEATSTVHIAKDITERKQAEEALRESELRYRTLFDSAPVGISMNAPDGKILVYNDVMRQLTGYSREEIEKINLRDLYQNPEERSLISELLQRDGFVRNHEVELKRKDGTKYHTNLNITRLRLGGEEVYMTLAENITELKEYRVSLERKVDERTKELNKALVDTVEARDRIDGILKSVADGLIVTDIYNRVVLMNSAAEDLLGVWFSKVFDRPIDFAIKENTLRDKIKETLSKKTTGYQFDFELPGTDPEHPRTLRARTSVIHGSEGKNTGIVTIINDVTHEREVDKMKTEFLSTAAHELRTPLTSIQGFSEVLLARDNLAPEEQRRFLTHINTQAVNLGKIISDLLDISRIESGMEFILERTPWDPVAGISQTVSYFQDSSKKHRFEVALPDEQVELNADKGKMEQVLKNLLSNAVKYSPEGGLVRVSGELLKNEYRITVADEGMGMTPEQVEKIFDKFYRVDASDTAIEGTGLGMTIVKYIVEAHGGRIWVESEHGKGTTVRFTIKG